MIYGDDNIHDAMEKVAGMQRYLRLRAAVRRKPDKATHGLRQALLRAQRKVQRRQGPDKAYRDASGRGFPGGERFSKRLKKR